MPNFTTTTPPAGDPRDRILNIIKPPPPDKDIREIRQCKEHCCLVPVKSPSPKSTRKEIPLTGWLTERDVALIMGCSVSLLQKDRHFHRGIPYTKRGRLSRYHIEDINNFMQARRIAPE